MAKYIYPLDNWKGFGYKFKEKTFYNTKHIGLDFIVPMDTPVKASISGLCTYRWGLQGGNQIIQIGDSSGFNPTDKQDIVRYMHLSKATFKEQKYFKQGEIIGYSGNTGLYTTAPHLHYDLQIKGQYVDPFKYLENNNNEITMPITEDVYKELDKRYVKKMISINFDPADGSYWLTGKELKYKLGTRQDDWMLAVATITGEIISDVEKNYKQTSDRKDILSKDKK